MSAVDKQQKQFSLSRVLIEAVKIHAEATGMKQSAIAEFGIREYLNKVGSEDVVLLLRQTQ